MQSELRFGFGKNWSNFLKHLTEARVQEASFSLQNFFQLKSLKGLSFLDVGSGSGLFSLAARQSEAKVTSFDFDIDSVNCTKFLKEKYNIQNDWAIFKGSIIDSELVKNLGQFDIVYSWGVLHHTGDMFCAFENISSLVKKEGYLYISIYNDQGSASRRWKWIKKTYNNAGVFVKSILILYSLLKQWGITFIKDTLKGNPFKTWYNYGRNNRGMSAYHDLIDWLGGYPFEVSKPEDVFYFFKKKGFVLEQIKTCTGGLGCNEFLFRKV